MHLKACVILLALLMSSTPPLCQLTGCCRLQLTSHSLYNEVSPPAPIILSGYSLLLFSRRLPWTCPVCFFFFFLSVQTLLDVFGYSFSLIHNKKLSPDHGAVILIVSLLCPVYSLDLLFRAVCNTC